VSQTARSVHVNIDSSTNYLVTSSFQAPLVRRFQHLSDLEGPLDMTARAPNFGFTWFEGTPTKEMF